MTLTKQELRAVIRALDLYGAKFLYVHMHSEDYEDYGLVREFRRALAAQLVEKLDDPDSAEAVELKTNDFEGTFRK